MKFGLNLYSIRNRLKTEEDFLAAACELREMGYSYIQFSGAPFEPEMVKRVSEASGLPVVLTHVPMDRILNDTEALVNGGECPVFDKYDEFIPPELLRLAYALDRLSADEVLERFE